MTGIRGVARIRMRVRFNEGTNIAGIEHLILSSDDYQHLGWYKDNPDVLVLQEWVIERGETQAEFLWRVSKEIGDAAMRFTLQAISDKLNNGEVWANLEIRPYL